jgi:hypothetical protein
MPSGLVSTGLAVGIDGHRLIDRYPAPVGNLGTAAKMAMREARDQPRDHIVALIAIVELLHQERQKRRVLIVGRRQYVVGVQVPEPFEDLDHLTVELTLGDDVHFASEQLQSLHGCHRMHRAFQRQVHIHVVDKHQGLIDDPAPLTCRQHARSRQELRHPDDRTEVRVLDLRAVSTRLRQPDSEFTVATPST